MLIMMLMMPFFSFYISFKVPAAVGFYWIISNLVANFAAAFPGQVLPAEAQPGQTDAGEHHLPALQRSEHQKLK